VSLFALFLFVVISLLIVRVGEKALVMTGLSRDVAGFQSISCFFGVGFTTNEAEMIVAHPVRRRIAAHLIIAGNIGLTGALSTLIVTFIQNDPDWLDHMIPLDGLGGFLLKIVAIVVCIYLIVWVFALKPTKSILDVLIERSLRRFYRVRIVDYETILRTEDGYSVMQVMIEEDNELVGSTLGGARLGSRGVLVLNIKRLNGDSIGTPHLTTEIMSGDQLTVYAQERLIPEVLMSNPTRGMAIESR
jgi:hypothetical protein